METVEVVIKLPKEDYAQYKSIAEWMLSNNFNTNNTLTKLQICIANGTVLPEGHGRLIDADSMKRIDAIQRGDFNSIESIRAWIDIMPTIVEANKEGENESNESNN